LEINSRPSGGFYYTQHTGINLIEDLICQKLNIENIREITPADAVVRTRIVSYKDAV
jgi:predicted ATP-grasp superfamily ATP-dependent carboligase